jgi:hypothetical protein
MKTLGLLFAIPMIACAFEPSDSSVSEDDLTQRGFSYTCAATSSADLLQKRKLTVVVTQDHLRFDGEDGLNLGKRDRSYAPRGAAARVRYNDFAWGDDCSLKLVMDTSALRGAVNPKLSVQCSNSDQFIQDTYQCSEPRAARLRIPAEPVPPPPVPEPLEPNASAPRWNCSTPFGPFAGDRIKVALDANAIRINGSSTLYGTRATSTSTSTMLYKDFDFYGDDCTLSVVADAAMLNSTARAAKFTVKCRGASLEQNTYNCTR